MQNYAYVNLFVLTWKFIWLFQLLEEEESDVPVSKEPAKMETDASQDAAPAGVDVNMQDAKDGVENGAPESGEKPVEMETDAKVTVSLRFYICTMFSWVEQLSSQVLNLVETGKTCIWLISLWFHLEVRGHRILICWLLLQVEAPKRKVKKTNVPVSELVYGGMLPLDVQKATEKEFEMALQDRVMEETKDKKNAVEAYVYDMRNKVRTSFYN